VSRALGILFVILLLLGGVLALSGLIVAKHPSARRFIDRLVPFQVLIGVALLAAALYVTVVVGPISMLRALQYDAVPALALIGGVVSGIALGFCFGMPQIARWLPGPSAGAKGIALSSKLAPYTMLFGAVAVGAALLLLASMLGLLKYV
jgi:hypothetical protein